MEELKRRLESIESTFSKEELDSTFPELAKFIMQNYGIETRGKTYLLNEIEFYYYDPHYDDMRTGAGKSRITYERDACAGQWFIHDYGVDLTFKSSKKEGYGGGILIRSIEEEATQKPITGPKKCLNELWVETVDAFSPTAPNPMVVRVPERNIELNDPDTRVTVEKVDKYKSNWRFTVKGKTVSRK